MRNFNYDENDEFHNDIDNFFGDDEEFEDEDEIYYQREMVHAMELELVEADLNLRLLETAIKINEKSFWWKFLSPKTKLKRIRITYRQLDKMIAQQNEPPKEE